MKLYDQLQNFHKMNVEDITDENLIKRFKGIAETILYDGYIQVREEYRVYVKTIEFYFHAEKDSPLKIVDPIVYHRAGKFPERVVPYFPLMTLHAHVSGFDITFENETLKYRASALIRAYTIFDINKGEFVKTKKEYNNEGIPYDDRSTFLYDFINGFPMIEGHNAIVWVDKETNVPHELKEPVKRKNVYRNYKGEDDSKMKEWTDRKWSFTRTNDVTP